MRLRFPAPARKRGFVPKLLSCLLIPAVFVACPDAGETEFSTPTPGITATPPSGDDDASSVDSSSTPVPALPRAASLGTADVTLDGELPGDMAGFATVLLPDMDGDGYGDMAVGAPGNDDRQPDAGKVYLLFGSDFGLDIAHLKDATASYQGEGRDDAAGTSLTSAGDLNGDGYPDLLIGAPGNDYGGPEAGRVYAVLGKSTGWYPGTRLANADFSLYGKEGDAIGQAGTVAAGGDLNGDGYDDIAIGAPFNAEAGEQSGKIYILTGRASGWEKAMALEGASLELIGSQPRDWAGFSVSIAKDLNGDGFDDLLIGAPQADAGGDMAGQVYAFLGKPTLPVMRIDLSASEARFFGSRAGEQAGACVADGGDVNGDGLHDILVGAWGETAESSSGAYYVVLGSKDFKSSSGPVAFSLTKAVARLTGSTLYEYAGRPAVGLGDINGDGLDDMLFGSPLFEQGSIYSAMEDAGGTYLFYGRKDGWAKLNSLAQFDYFLAGERAYDYAGATLSGQADLNADGYMDLAVGSFGVDKVGGSLVGQAYLVLGGNPFHPMLP